MLMTLQLKLARWANWLTSLSHVSPLELIDPLWTLIVIAANAYHIAEAFRAPLKHPASGELLETLRQALGGSTENIVLGDCFRMIWQLAKAFAGAYVDGIKVHKWPAIFALVGAIKIIGLIM